MLPRTKTRASSASGEEVFAKRSEAEQLEILGAGKLEAYKAGKLKLNDLVGERNDARWGRVRYEKPLKDVAPMAVGGKGGRPPRMRFL
jgi:hypothetical protein